MSTMQDPDGSDGLGLELGEEDLLFPGHRNVSIQPVTPAVDRLDPSVPHSEEFDYTFQEMMQATADEVNDRSAAIRRRQGTTFSSPEMMLEKATPRAYDRTMHASCAHSLHPDGRALLVSAPLFWAVSLFGRRCRLPNGLRGD
jgi:hypothetical protein